MDWMEVNSIRMLMLWCDYILMLGFLFFYVGPDAGWLGHQFPTVGHLMSPVRPLRFKPPDVPLSDARWRMQKEQYYQFS